ncbi:MAG: hypothetical protein ACFE8L_12600 [Candidatus Hodarchaeota archaeon]
MEMKKLPKITLKPVGPRKSLCEEDLIKISYPEFKSGPGEPPKGILEKKMIEFVTDDWKNKIDIPEWIIKSFNQPISYEEIFNKAIEHIRKKPSEENLRQVQFILNEIGKLNEGISFLHSKINRDLVKEFLMGGK